MIGCTTSCPISRSRRRFSWSSLSSGSSWQYSWPKHTGSVGIFQNYCTFYNDHNKVRTKQQQLTVTSSSDRQTAHHCYVYCQTTWLSVTTLVFHIHHSTLSFYHSPLSRCLICTSFIHHQHTNFNQQTLFLYLDHLSRSSTTYSPLLYYPKYLLMSIPKLREDERHSTPTEDEIDVCSGNIIPKLTKTAKCGTCERKNKSTIYTCDKCSWRMCTPCFERNDGDSTHPSGVGSARAASRYQEYARSEAGSPSPASLGSSSAGLSKTSPTSDPAVTHGSPLSHTHETGLSQGTGAVSPSGGTLASTHAGPSGQSDSTSRASHNEVASHAVNEPEEDLEISPIAQVGPPITNSRTRLADFGEHAMLSRRAARLSRLTRPSLETNILAEYQRMERAIFQPSSVQGTEQVPQTQQEPGFRRISEGSIQGHITAADFGTAAGDRPRRTVNNPNYNVTRLSSTIHNQLEFSNKKSKDEGKRRLSTTPLQDEPQTGSIQSFAHPRYSKQPFADPMLASSTEDTEAQGLSDAIKPSAARQTRRQPVIVIPSDSDTGTAKPTTTGRKSKISKLNEPESEPESKPRRGLKRKVDKGKASERTLEEAPAAGAPPAFFTAHSSYVTAMWAERAARGRHRSARSTRPQQTTETVTANDPTRTQQRTEVERTIRSRRAQQSSGLNPASVDAALANLIPGRNPPPDDGRDGQRITEAFKYWKGVDPTTSRPGPLTRNSGSSLSDPNHYINTALSIRPRRGGNPIIPSTAPTATDRDDPTPMLSRAEADSDIAAMSGVDPAGNFHGTHYWNALVEVASVAHAVEASRSTAALAPSDLKTVFRNAGVLPSPQVQYPESAIRSSIERERLVLGGGAGAGSAERDGSEGEETPREHQATDAWEIYKNARAKSQ
ncbi:hypothetical protein M501DRAFT_171963 [Patellaria atrata CBS 101060]|uniref:Uncharacterized protein n=1 Tax=Patellaria atrata CBS 101060 TaxID=1346257 RepID=A0A9P4VQ78_9PEZI|nr:hypothetical protein M501DRAFT_171963 [Patellaria atrata CBS 101060]